MAPFLLYGHSGLVTAAALDQVADGDHRKHQQVGGEDGHQPADEGMEKRERIWGSDTGDGTSYKMGADGSLLVVWVLRFSYSSGP